VIVTLGLVDGVTTMWQVILECMSVIVTGTFLGL